MLFFFHQLKNEILYPFSSGNVIVFHRPKIYYPFKPFEFTFCLNLIFLFFLPFFGLSSSMPVDPMDDIELRSVQLQFSNGRGSLNGTCDLRRVVTDKGDVLVAVQGDTSKPAILTYHDLGLNCM